MSRVIVMCVLFAACTSSEPPATSDVRATGSGTALPIPITGVLTAACGAFKAHVETFVQCDKLTADVKQQMSESAASITGPNEDTGCQSATALLEQTARTLGCRF